MALGKPDENIHCGSTHACSNFGTLSYVAQPDGSRVSSIVTLGWQYHEIMTGVLRPFCPKHSTEGKARATVVKALSTPPPRLTLKPKTVEKVPTGPRAPSRKSTRGR